MTDPDDIAAQVRLLEGISDGQEAKTLAFEIIRTLQGQVNLLLEDYYEQLSRNSETVCEMCGMYSEQRQTLSQLVSELQAYIDHLRSPNRNPQMNLIIERTFIETITRFLKELS